MGADNYKVEGGFECSVVFFLATSRGFPYRFINHLSPELFTSPYAQLFVDLLTKYFKKKNRVPGSLNAAVNLITQWFNRGKITHKVKRGAIEYLLDTAWYGAADEEREVAQQFAELMQQWMHYKSALMAAGLAGERKSLSDVAKYIMEADALLHEKGDQETYANITDIGTWIKLIGESGALHRWPTGVADWDVSFGGGQAQGTLLIIIGPSAAGKSMVLSQMTASCVLRGGDAAYISLEVDKAQIASRIMAPIAGIPIDFVVKRTAGIHSYLEQSYRRHGIGGLGNLYVEHYPEGSTVNEVLVSLDKAFEHGMRKGKPKPKHFYFDYLDRFGGGAVRGKDLYSTGADVTQALRNYIEVNKAWGTSACQSKRFVSKAAYKDSGLDSVSDSMHKVRIADDVINLLFNKDGPNGDEIASVISKHRSGRAGQKTPFVPVDYSYGIVFPSSDFEPVSMKELAYDPYFADLADDR